MKLPLSAVVLRMARAMTLGLLLVIAGRATAAAGGFRAGAAAVDITPRNAPPEAPSIVAGGFLEGRADRVHDPLLVRAIVIDDGGAEGQPPVRLALVVVDTCMMPQALIDEAKALAVERTGIPVEQIMVSATHTHSAPAAMGCLGTRVDAPYAARLPAAIASAVAQADERLAPARIGWGKVDDWHHTHNRRWVRRPETRVVDPFGNPTGLAHMHPGHLSKEIIGPSGPVDPQLSVISIQDAAGKPLALFANYSQHYFGSPAVSADYFGLFSKFVASALGEPGEGNGPFVCALSQGTSGDLMWMDYGAEQRPTAIHDYAAAVARKALGVIESIAYRDDVSLAMTEKVLDLGYRLPNEARLAWARGIAAGITDDLPKNLPEVYAREAIILHERKRTTVKLQAIRIGELTIATLPNEVYALTGLKLRNRSPAAMHFNVELANGAEGYIPPPEQHVLGGYTTWPARTAGLEVAAETKIVDTLVAALEEVTGKPRRGPADRHGPAAEAVVAAKPVGFWRLDDEDGSEPRSALADGSPATLTPGFAWYLPGVGTGTGCGDGEALVPSAFSPDDSINRAVHFAGGGLVLPGQVAAGDASLVAWVWLGERSGASDRQGTLCTGLTAEPLLARQDADHALGFSLGDRRTDMRFRADDWHQVAVVRRGDSVDVHVDGHPQPMLTGEAIKGTAAIVLGNGLQGKLDEVALFDSALDAATIATLWEASSIGVERAAAAERERAAEERQTRLAGVPQFPADHAARLAVLRPTRSWTLAEQPADLVATGEISFHPQARAAFRGGRLAGRDEALDADWSVAFWFRSDVPPESRPVAAYLFSRGPAGAAGAPGDHLGLGGSAVPGGAGKLILFDGNDRNGLLVGQTVVPPGTWNYVVLVRRGEEATVWLNGGEEPEIDGTLEVTAGDSREFFIGARSDTFAPLAGRLAEVSLFDRALDPPEAAELFAASGQKPGEPVLAPVADDGPRSPEETRLGIRVPPGYRVELVASEPDVLDPVAFDWDQQGRLWVVEMADYPSGMDGNGAPGGRVRRLEDKDGDGRYETSVLFAEGLSFPNGIAVWRNGVVVTAAPQILFLADEDGDGVCDRREVILEGFMEGNQQLRVNGLRLGLDGLLWCASGGHHPGHGTETVITSQPSGRKVTLGSHDFRFHPDSGSVWIESGPSQFGRNRDPFGHWFGTQNANPLWQWVIPEAAAARNRFVAPEQTTHHVVGANSPPVRPASTPEKRFHSFEQSGRYTSACGSTIDGNGTLFDAGPGTLHAFTCEPFHNLVQHNELIDDGASFSARWPEEEGPTDFFASDDRWCRPVMARIGPDGALYVADMVRAMIEHPDWLPPEGRAEMLPKYRLGDDRGRIWRVVRAGAPPARFPAAVVAAQTPADLVALVESGNTWQRDHAMRRILHESDAAFQNAAAVLLADVVRSSPRPESRVQAIATLVRMDKFPAELALSALADPHSRVREVAVTFAGESPSPEVRRKVCSLATDPDAKVRLQVAILCGEWPDPEAGAALAAIAVSDHADPLFRSAVMTSALPHAEALSRAIASAAPEVAAVYRESILRMAVGQGRAATVTALLAGALAAPQAIRTSSLDPLLADMQRVGVDPWGMNVAAETLDGLDRELERAGDVASDATEPPEIRLAAARLLSRAGKTRDGAVALLATWLVPQVDPDVQAEAIESLARSGAAGVPGAFAEAWPALGPASRTRAVDAWLSRPEWMADLLDRVESGLLASGNLSLQQRDRLLGSPDGVLAARAKTLLVGGESATRKDVVARYRVALEGDGDATRGRDTYLRVCAACHRRGEYGHDVGPNLATVIEHAPQRLLANILDPNADIQPGYQASTCVLESGEVVAGLIAAETGGSVTMKLADGTVRNIARAEIDELVTSNRSFMPEGVEETVSVEQMADLIAFLRGGL
ncbi:MAG: HEAT repeat domain-containing protein [Planctomycetota bacterium]|nr:HEAT repeat domain-containing protein [Planctomycetota bacterium]